MEWVGQENRHCPSTFPKVVEVALKTAEEGRSVADMEGMREVLPTRYLMTALSALRARKAPHVGSKLRLQVDD